MTWSWAREEEFSRLFAVEGAGVAARGNQATSGNGIAIEIGVAVAASGLHAIAWLAEFGVASNYKYANAPGTETAESYK